MHRTQVTLLLVLLVPAAVVGQGRFPSGTEAAARMTVPPGFVVTCFASEPDVVNPIAIDFDHRGRVWVLENLTYPKKAPAGKGRDRIRIYEDTNGDGIADKVTLFAEGLNMATGLAVGHGGVFVGEAPELVFLEDTNGDDHADKRTVLLDGWGLQDTHETLNSFSWGPDGWLYGCHGVFTHSKVGKPGSPEAERVRLNAAIWRYHPKSQKFELWAEGTSNPWGWDYDEHGSGFLTACVIPHLFHTFPGGKYLRQAGQNFNPYQFGEVGPICDHLHYIGSHSHAGNQDPRRFAVGGGHAHSGCLIYQGGSFPEKWHGRVFMNNIHGSRINTDVLKRNGATYTGSHGEDFLVANDPNNRIIQLRTGPDGSVYMIDWYDPQICHNTDQAVWDRDHGRIFKVRFIGENRPAPPAPAVGDVAKRSSAELVELLRHENSWWWRRALLILGERGDPSVVPALRELARSAKDVRHRLRAMWALAYLGATDQATLVSWLKDDEPWVRAWGVRLLVDAAPFPGDEAWRQVLKMAANESNPDVMLQLAAAGQAWTQRDVAWRELPQLADTLVGRFEFANDPVLPLMFWLADQPNFTKNKFWALPYLAFDPRTHQGTPVPDEFRTRLLESKLFRDYITPRRLRWLVAQDANHLEMGMGVLFHFHEPRACLAALDGILEGLRGRREPAPPSWKKIDDFRTAYQPRRDILHRLDRLGAHFGDAPAIARLEATALDKTRSPHERLTAVQALMVARQASSVEPLTALAMGDTEPDLKREALQALAAFDSTTVPTALLRDWPKLPPDLRKEALGLLTSRRGWAKVLLGAVKDGRVDRKDLTENEARRIAEFRDEDLNRDLEAAWGKLNANTPAKVNEQLAKIRRDLAAHSGDRATGKAIFTKHCSICHTLRGEGNAVGPDLTGANRRDLDYLLINILDPNRVVGKDYYTAMALDKSGRLHTGLVHEDTPQHLVLKGENAKLTTLPKSDLEEFKLVEKSLMPEGLPDTMTATDFRHLLAYVMEDPFLSRGLIAGPFKMAPDFDGPIETAAHPLKAPGVAWKPFDAGAAGLIEMERFRVQAPPTDSTAYVYHEVVAPRALRTTMELAAHHDVKVWVNGKLAHRRFPSREARRFEVELNAGVNTVLIKVHNIYGNSWLWSRLADPDRVLEIRTLDGTQSGEK